MAIGDWPGIMRGWPLCPPAAGDGAPTGIICCMPGGLWRCFKAMLWRSISKFSTATPMRGTRMRDWLL